MLLLALMLLGPLPNSTHFETPGNLSSDIYYSSIDASGSRLCGRKQSAEYQRQFDGEYGERINALVTYHIRKFGPDADFVYTTSCRQSLLSRSKQDQQHMQALSHFESTLQELEQRYGPAENGS